MSNDFYIYVHYRLSDNKPFYVGKGRGGRAYSKKNRNQYWQNIVDKCGYHVEIVFENLDEETAFQCEKDTILEFKYFGYELCNLTEGGEGLSGYKFTEEQKVKISEALKGRKRPEDVVRKINKKNQGKKRTEEQLLNLSVCQLGNKNRLDKNIYLFYSNSNIFIGTRRQLEEFASLKTNSINCLFRKHGPSTHKGWSVLLSK